MSAGIKSNHVYDRPQLDFLASSTGDPAIDADLSYIQTLNWSQTFLGPLQTWPSDLLVLVNLAMLSPQPQLFLLGPEAIILYNTAYGKLLRDHHPEYQGRPIGLNDALIAQTKAINRIVDNADKRTRPANENHVPFFMANNGRLEEVFLSATMVKIPRQMGSFHATTYDTTSDTVKARRDRALEHIMNEAASAKSLPLLWDALINGMAAADSDIPFAALYTARTWLERDPTTDFTYMKIDTQHFLLHGLVGDYEVMPATNLDLDSESLEGWVAVLSKARQSHEPLVLERQRGNLPDEFSQASRKRCYGDDCQDAVVLSTNLRSGEDIHGLLVLGLAPRRPYDDAYRSWIRTLQRSIANLVGSVVISDARALAAQNDAKRAEREAMSHARELFLKEQEALLATGKVQRMLDVMQSANVGIFECLLSGDIIHINEAFSIFSGHPRAIETEAFVSIFTLCGPDQLETLKTHWHQLSAGIASSFTLSLGRDRQDLRWVQLACTPVINNGSSVESITGCVTDITAQKQVEWEAIKRAQALEQLRLSELQLLQEAVEARRQQENFIDMTSHEIRNPLSAVIHCTDSISQTLEDMKNDLEHVKTSSNSRRIDEFEIARLQESRQEIEDMVEVIASCTTHQKRITDDILSLSKLDSNLLEICASRFDSKKLLDQLNFTFTAEAERAQVKLITSYDPRVDSVQWVEADPGRVMQILINLVANAIKFTRDQADNRTVSVSMSIVKEVSAKMLENLIMARELEPGKEKPQEPRADIVYLWFEVRDTGCGMDADARSRMFSRFAQASPKTYSTYGGSGLGLFVSQKLVTLQHGNIGFTSEAGAGSTFAFYVKALQRSPPEDDIVNAALSIGQDDLSTLELSLRGLSILLVEDNIVNRKVLAKQLHRNGFTVYTAEHGKAALDFMASTRHWVSGGRDPIDQHEARPKIDLILMDVEMPVMNGIDCTAAIRLAEQKGRIDCHIPIIATTANARPEQLRQTIDVGMDDALSKPFHVHELFRVIESLRRKQTLLERHGRHSE